MTHDELLVYIRQQVIRIGSQKMAATRWGISAQYLCDVVLGRRPVGPALLKALHLKKVVTYHPVTED